MVQANIGGVDIFQLSLPQPRYKPIKIGQSVEKSRLDYILEAANLSYQEYILYVEAFQVSFKLFLL